MRVRKIFFTNTVNVKSCFSLAKLRIGSISENLQSASWRIASRNVLK